MVELILKSWCMGFAPSPGCNKSLLKDKQYIILLELWRIQDRSSYFMSLRRNYKVRLLYISIPKYKHNLCFIN